MKLFNATNSLLDLPWGSQRLSIAPRSFSQDFMGTPDFIKMLTTTYNNEEVAIVVAGPYELSMCASVPVAVNYVVQSMDEAIQRFGLNNDDGNSDVQKDENKEEEIEVTEEEVKEEKEEKTEKPKTTKKARKTTKK